MPLSWANLAVHHDTPWGPYWAQVGVPVVPWWAQGLQQELVAEAASWLDGYVDDQIRFIDPHRKWSLRHLLEPADYYEWSADETGGMTLDELIPGAIDEWRRIRGEAVS